ncbi:MAG TPA: TetR family transcriptional regulator [Solirubrobacteraceae bacterium]|jgi:AcrR family transcriptional regulator|nr:TetR family transcriptional regulator [Solirubrobacteraceae bacterium]
MIIPVGGTDSGERGEWSRLDPEAKRERLLDAATGVFARHGLDAPMSEVAEAAGAGVASIYRAFGSKHELLATLVTRRMSQLAAAAEEADRRGGDRWTALTEMVRSLVAGQRADYTMLEARMRVADHPDVIEAVARATAAQERLLAAARAEGRLRADATTLDLRLLFAATRAARNVEPDRWRRMLELMIDALDTRRGR